MINVGKVLLSKLSTSFLVPSSSSPASLPSSSSSLSLSSSSMSSIKNNHYKMTYFVVFIIAVSSMIHRTDGCYLRNCPLGKWEGKRSNGESLYDRQQPIKLCPACGPIGNGRCIGPNICCIPGTGCLVGKGLPFTRQCSREDENPIPCKPEGLPCGNRGEGICGNEGTCCNEESCSVSLECTSVNPMVVDILKILRGY